MHAPKKELTDEDLARTLAKHAPGAIPVPVTAARPPEPHVAALVWEKPKHDRDGAGQPTGTGHQLSACHRFVVAKVRMKPDEYKYTASMRRVPPLAAEVLGSFSNADDARAICEKHR